MVEEIRQGDIPGVQLRCRQQLPAPIEEVWRWLTDTGRLDRWLSDRAWIDPSDGSVLILESSTGAGHLRRERLATRRRDRPHRWTIDFERLDSDWPTSTRLVFELHETAQGTELSVLQQGFAHLPLSDCLTIWESYRRRWRRALARLEAALQTSIPEHH